MDFSDLGLSAELLDAINAEGYSTPTPIQAQAIPAVLKGHDLLASAQTGTGKTAGFGLPLLQRLNQGKRASSRQVRALVLAPTRELAAQVGKSIATYGAKLPLRTQIIFGGVGQNPQVEALKRGVDVLIATPGRLLDLQQQGHVDLSRLEVLVLDEADRMLDMGFIHDIKRLLRLMPAKRQNLLFSATFSNEIQALAKQLLHDPKMIEVAQRNATADKVEQTVYQVDREKKRDLLAHLIETQKWYQVLVFSRTKHGANRLAEQLSKRSIPAMAIHGNKSQGARTRALGAFKSGELQVLVATDIAARGIDIHQLPYVVNFDLPNVAEDYVHRIGRTGRAGSQGEAISLVCIDEAQLLKNIERLIKSSLERRIEPGFEPDPNAVAQPIENGRRSDPPRNANRAAKPGRTRKPRTRNRSSSERS